MMKFNPLLDKFPVEYNGVRMNTDFRVGILLSILFNSAKFTDDEKKVQALTLLYGDDLDSLGVDVMTLWDGLVWFMNVGYNKCTNSVANNKSNSENEEDENDLVDSQGNKLIFDMDSQSSNDDVLDFEFDASRIYTAFLRTYGVDLTEAEMHFFKFMFMLSDLESDCSHSRVVEIRQTNVRDMDKKQRKAYLHLKKIYAIPVEIDEKTKEELAVMGISEETLEHFMQY